MDEIQQAGALMAHRPTLTLEGAKVALAAAEATARAEGVPLAIAVADTAGNLLAFSRMDGAPLVVIEVVMNKARSAAQLGCPTRVFQDMVNKSGPALLAATNITPLEGGMPIIVDGVVLGSVAASGAASDVDARIAQVGVDAVIAALGSK